MKQVLSAVTLLFALASPAWSAQIRGLSNMECDFLNGYHTTETKEWSAVKQWIYGYMSGINIATEAYDEVDFFAQVHYDAAYRCIKRYCENNPEKTIMTGVVAFTTEVRSSRN